MLVHSIIINYYDKSFLGFLYKIQAITFCFAPGWSESHHTQGKKNKTDWFKKWFECFSHLLAPWPLLPRGEGWGA